VHDRLAGGEHPLAVRIPCRVGQVIDHVAHDLFGRVKAEHGKIADIEFDETAPFCFHLLGLVHDRTADVVKNVVKLGGFFNLLHFRLGPEWFKVLQGRI